ncbi:MAG: hypothetical protein PHH98_04155 [Candidatus Gracilibacteria bacterium]|nr:hypothetical protein [Candidatus Gracilibacteria bacterium]
MEEKVKKTTKCKTFKKVLLVFLISFMIRETYAMYIDMYNFRQLEKVKIILKDIKREDKEFFNLNEFNKIYNVNIQPIKNCYHISNYNGNEKYIFGFKLESFINMIIYKTAYYAYPKYDLPYLPMGDSSGRFDYNNDKFINIISRPCEEN